MGPKARTTSVLVGVAVAVGSWFILLPWDLSEVDAEGRTLARGGDDYFLPIFLVAIIVFVVALLVAIRGRHEAAYPVALGGLGSWALLFLWRAGAARTSGANFFVAAFIMFVAPTGLILLAIIKGIANRLRRRSTG